MYRHEWPGWLPVERVQSMQLDGLYFKQVKDPAPRSLGVWYVAIASYLYRPTNGFSGQYHTSHLHIPCLFLVANSGWVNLGVQVIVQTFDGEMEPWELEGWIRWGNGDTLTMINVDTPQMWDYSARRPPKTWWRCCTGSPPQTQWWDQTSSSPPPSRVPWRYWTHSCRRIDTNITFTQDL